MVNALFVDVLFTFDSNEEAEHGNDELVLHPLDCRVHSTISLCLRIASCVRQEQLATTATKTINFHC